jgi:ATP/maltotriose-dependent transcriptional regulator MalT
VGHGGTRGGAPAAAIDEPLWLVIDDLHELRSSEALRQPKLLLMRSPAELRFVFLRRRDLRLGLPRLRLEGDLTEIRADDLCFSLDEARALFAAAGVPVADSALELLHERTEGWAAGLRMAALSLAGHPDPDGFAAQFSGSERSVAEYLLDVSDTELRVLRYLPTNLPAPEIASELFVSVNTIRTHTRHLYNKLDVHTRAQAVERARELGLLAPTPRSR